MKKILIATALFLASFSAFAEPVNINTASAITIAESIKGIGLSKAQAIVDYRENHGQFRSVDELVMVKGIGTRTVERIREDVLVETVDGLTPATESALSPQVSDNMQ